MGNLNVSLTDELVSYVKTKVESGRYASSSEVVREALRLMEKHDQAEGERLRFLQQAWQDGIDSGDFRPLDAEAIKAEGRKRLMAKSPSPRLASASSKFRFKSAGGHRSIRPLRASRGSDHAQTGRQ